MKDNTYFHNKFQKIEFPQDENGNFYFSHEKISEIINALNKAKTIIDHQYKDDLNIKNGFNVNSILMEIDRRSENGEHIENHLLIEAMLMQLAFSGSIGEVKSLLFPHSWLSRVRIELLKAEFPWSLLEGNGPKKSSWVKGNIENVSDRFLRNSSHRGMGSLQEDAIQNIKASLDAVFVAANYNITGAFYYSYRGTHYSYKYGSEAQFNNLVFDASRVVRTANETRPKNIAVLMVKKVFAYPKEKWINDYREKFKGFILNE